MVRYWKRAARKRQVARITWQPINIVFTLSLGPIIVGQKEPMYCAIPKSDI